MNSFKIFKEEVERTLDLFQLSGRYRVSIDSYTQADDDALARYYVDTTASNADIRLNLYHADSSDTTEKDIIHAARHEALHILLIDLSNLVYTRNISDDMVEQAEHCIINTIIQTLMEDC